MGASPLPGADRHSSLSECGRRSIRPQLKKMVSALQRFFKATLPVLI